MLVSELIDRALHEWLYPGGDEQPQFDFLAEDIDSAVTTVTLQGRAEFVPKDSNLQIGSEILLVSETSGSEVTIAERGFANSTATNHVDGDIVWVDPTFTRIEIFDTLRALISKFYSWGLYRRVVDESNVFTTRSVITMPASTKQVHRILVRDSSTEERWTYLGMKGQAWVEYKEFDPPKIQIRCGGTEGAEMRMVCMNDFVLPTAETDDLLAVCGIPATLQEGLPMAVAGQVLLAREVPRAVVDRIREGLAAQGQQVGMILNVGGTLVSNFRRDDVAAERRRLDETDDPAFEWQGVR